MQPLGNILQLAPNLKSIFRYILPVETQQGNISDKVTSRWSHATFCLSWCESYWLSWTLTHIKSEVIKYESFETMWSLKTALCSLSHVRWSYISKHTTKIGVKLASVVWGVHIIALVWKWSTMVNVCIMCAWFTTFLRPTDFKLKLLGWLSIRIVLYFSYYSEISSVTYCSLCPFKSWFL